MRFFTPRKGGGRAHRQFLFWGFRDHSAIKLVLLLCLYPPLFSFSSGSPVEMCQKVMQHGVCPPDRFWTTRMKIVVGFVFPQNGSREKAEVVAATTANGYGRHHGKHGCAAQDP